METQSSKELRIELEQLLKKQSRTLETRLSGKANDMEIVQYEIRQDVIREMWERLAQSAST